MARNMLDMGLAVFTIIHVKICIYKEGYGVHYDEYGTSGV